MKRVPREWLSAVEGCEGRDLCFRGSEPGPSGAADDSGAVAARQEADRLVLEKPERIKKRLKARFAQVPGERALVDELIAERREEFSIEDERRESV